MKRLLFHEVGAAYSDWHLQELESCLGFPVPPDVLAFLRTNNGGRPLYCEFNIPSIDDVVDLHEVLGIGAPKGIKYWTEIFRGVHFDGRFPSLMFPVAFETYGNCVLVCRDGSVHYWDVYDIYKGAHGTSVYHIASSFSLFIDSVERVILD